MVALRGTQHERLGFYVFAFRGFSGYRLRFVRAPEIHTAVPLNFLTKLNIGCRLSRKELCIGRAT